MRWWENTINTEVRVKAIGGLEIIWVRAGRLFQFIHTK